jgi:hypothetical protein
VSAQYRLHRNAALRTGRRRPPRPEPVVTLTVNRRVWAEALLWADGDPRRIEIRSATYVIVTDPREG